MKSFKTPTDNSEQNVASKIFGLTGAPEVSKLRNSAGHFQKVTVCGDSLYVSRFKMNG